MSTFTNLLRKFGLYVAIFVLGMVAIPVLDGWALPDTNPIVTPRAVPASYKAAQLPHVADKDLAYIQLGGYEYAIPKRHFSGLMQEQCNSSSVLLHFKPLTHDQFAQQEWPDFPAFSSLEVNSMQLMIQTSFRPGITSQKALEKQFELDSRGVIRRPVPYRDLNLSIPFREAELDRNIKKAHNYQEHVFSYYEKDILTTYITCNPLGTEKNPNCAQRFIIDGSIVTVDYEFQYLYLWKEIESGFKRLIASWRLGPVQKRLPPCCQTFDCFVSLKKEK
jgi:hypothetical protein